MSRFALVSKESFSFLQTINPSLTRDLSIYFESEPQYRMFLATNTLNQETANLTAVFEQMGQSENGKRILNLIGMDRLRNNFV